MGAVALRSEDLGSRCPTAGDKGEKWEHAAKIKTKTLYMTFHLIESTD